MIFFGFCGTMRERGAEAAAGTTGAEAFVSPFPSSLSVSQFCFLPFSLLRISLSNGCRRNLATDGGVRRVQLGKAEDRPIEPAVVALLSFNLLI